MKHVFITGVMGSGKTTVAKKLAPKLFGSYFSETDNLSPYVEESLTSDKQSIRLLAQLDLLGELVKNINFVKPINNVRVYDTSVLVNKAFAETLLEPLEYNTYNDVFESYVDANLIPKGIHIILTTPYSDMIERIKSRGVEYEKNINYDLLKSYHRDFNDNVINAITELGIEQSRVIIIDTGLNSADDVVELAIDFIRSVND